MDAHLLRYQVPEAASPKSDTRGMWTLAPTLPMMTSSKLFCRFE